MPRKTQHPRAQKAVVVLTGLGGVCILASHEIKPSAVLPYPALGLWLVALVLFIAALVLAVRALTA